MLQQEYKPVKKSWVNKTRLVCGGLIIISSAIMYSFIQIGVYNFVQVGVFNASKGLYISSKVLDIPAFISVLAFALAIPFLALQFLTASEDASRKYSRDDTPGLKITYGIGIFAASIGIILAFWHVSPFAGGVVLVSILIAVVLYIEYVLKLHGIDEKVRKDKKTDNLD